MHRGMFAECEPQVLNLSVQQFAFETGSPNRSVMKSTCMEEFCLCDGNHTHMAGFEHGDCQEREN